MFDSLAQYYSLTGDDQYNLISSQALFFQKDDNNNIFMPRNQSRNEGNDDQATWALAGLSATDSQIPTGNTSYLEIAQDVFDAMVQRWDEMSCGGGLRWQIFVFNSGYDFKNTASNGNFFQLAARLAQQTGNTTYAEWATKTFEWTQKVGLMDDDWNVFDGVMTTDNCKQLNKIQWTASAGAYVAGAASMYNTTGGDGTWKVRLDGLLDRTLEVFFPDGVATERACEGNGRCNTDMAAYKGVLARQLVDTIKAAPYTADKLRPFLTSSAEGAAAACDANGEKCGLVWNSTSSENSGLGQSLGALGFVQSLLLWDSESGAGNATTTGTSTSGNQPSSTAGANVTTTTTANGASSFSKGISGALFGGVLFLVMLAAL